MTYPYTYPGADFADPAITQYMRGLKDLIVNNPSVFVEVGDEEGMVLPIITADSIHIGPVPDENPQLITMEGETKPPIDPSISRQETAEIRLIVKSGTNGLPDEQFQRSANITKAISRLVCRVMRDGQLSAVLCYRWPLNNDLTKLIPIIKLDAIEELPNNLPGSKVYGYKGGLRLNLSIQYRAIDESSLPK